MRNIESKWLITSNHLPCMTLDCFKRALSNIFCHAITTDQHPICKVTLSHHQRGGVDAMSVATRSFPCEGVCALDEECEKKSPYGVTTTAMGTTATGLHGGGVCTNPTVHETTAPSAIATLIEKDMAAPMRPFLKLQGVPPQGRRPVARRPPLTPPGTLAGVVRESAARTCDREFPLLPGWNPQLRRACPKLPVPAPPVDDETAKVKVTIIGACTTDAARMLGDYS
mmetsp:Transcript_45127/g.88289  ORF Transcript_45127/g.88289 Transcript_45127/m.88289 type:complete len:226 (-) Transcript_45127:84-761(-)